MKTIIWACDKCGKRKEGELILHHHSWETSWGEGVIEAFGFYGNLTLCPECNKGWESFRLHLVDHVENYLDKSLKEWTRH